DAGFDLDGPVNAAGLPVDGEKVALRISDVEAPSNDNGLRASGTRPGETERPFQMEARNIIRGNACNFGRLKTRIRDRDAPTVPGRSVQALAERLRAIGVKCRSEERRVGKEGRWARATAHERNTSRDRQE